MDTRSKFDAVPKDTLVCLLAPQPRPAWLTSKKSSAILRGPLSYVGLEHAAKPLGIHLPHHSMQPLLCGIHLPL
jgi:hypothetical protein